MKDKKALTVLAVIGLGLWAWSKAKPAKIPVYNTQAQDKLQKAIQSLPAPLPESAQSIYEDTLIAQREAAQEVARAEGTTLAEKAVSIAKANIEWSQSTGVYIAPTAGMTRAEFLSSEYNTQSPDITAEQLFYTQGGSPSEWRAMQAAPAPSPYISEAEAPTPVAPAPSPQITVEEMLAGYGF